MAVFILTYWAVFAAELVGDKLLYTTSVLAARYRAGPIVMGATLAFVVKLGAAVLLGEAVSRTPRFLVGTITTVSFVWVAYGLWKKPLHGDATVAPGESSRGATMSFVLVLLSEWADLGQVTTATMVARFGSPVSVWLGAVCAMITKCSLAAWLGADIRRRLRDRLSPRMVRYGSASLLLLLGVLSVAESLLRHP